jgi:hypothetical protein
VGSEPVSRCACSMVAPCSAADKTGLGSNACVEVGGVVSSAGLSRRRLPRRAARRWVPPAGPACRHGSAARVELCRHDGEAWWRRRLAREPDFRALFRVWRTGATDSRRTAPTDAGPILVGPSLDIRTPSKRIRRSSERPLRIDRPARPAGAHRVAFPNARRRPAPHRDPSPAGPHASLHRPARGAGRSRRLHPALRRGAGPRARRDRLPCSSLGHGRASAGRPRGCQDLPLLPARRPPRPGPAGAAESAGQGPRASARALDHGRRPGTGWDRRPAHPMGALAAPRSAAGRAARSARAGRPHGARFPALQRCAPRSRRVGPRRLLGRGARADRPHRGGARTTDRRRPRALARASRPARVDRSRRRATPPGRSRAIVRSSSSCSGR